MGDDRIVISSGSALNPETVANRTFASSFRGYDQAEVRMFLKRIAEELTAASEREGQLHRSLQEAMSQAAHPELDEEMLTAALGEHTARLLGNARETAAAVVSEAESRSARMLHEGEGRIARMRAEAETLLARRAEEAERLAGGLRQAAESDARTLRERARADAHAEIEAARAQGREMVGEAKELRERMLTDLLRRRRMGEAQVEQLRLAHQRLLEAYSVVRRTLEEATDELAAAEADTRPVAEAIHARAEAHLQRPAAEEERYRGEPRARPEFDQASRRSSSGAPAFNPAPLEAPGGASEPVPEPAADEAPGAGETAPGEEPAPGRGEPKVRDGFAAAAAAAAAAAKAADDAAGGDASAGPAVTSDDVIAVSALGAGVAPVEPSAGRPGDTLPPVDMPAPGEEVRVVRDDERKPSGLRRRGRSKGRGGHGREEQPTKQEEPATGAPAPGAEARTEEPGEGDRRPSGEESQSPQVEELFARLRAAQQRRDAESAAARTAPEVVAHGAPGPAAGASAAEVTAPAPPGPSGPTQRGAQAPTAAPPAEGGAPAVRDESADGDEKLLFRRDELLDPIDSELSRRLKRVLQDDQNEVLDRLRRQRRPVPEATLPDLVGQTERYREAAAPFLRQAAHTGASFVSGPDPDAAPDGIEAFVDGWAAELAIELVVPLRERLERALNDAGGGADDEAGDATVGDRLSASYRQWKLQQVEKVARHYSSTAFTRGAFGATVDGASLRWVVDDDGPCPDCEDNALAGPTAKGETYPTGQTHPPAHPGCRCLLVPSAV